MKLSKKIFSTFAMSAMAASGLLSSCSVDDFIAHKDDIIKKLGDFKFSTSNEVVLDIDYGPLASQALVQVYSENPLANATEEDQTPEGELVFSAFLDKNGIYCGTVDIPAHANHLYFYTSSMAAPMLMDAEMKDGRVTVANNMTSPRSTRADATTRAVDDNELVVRKLNSNENGGSAQNFYTIFGGWDNYGRVNDINGLVDEGTLTADDVQSIEHYFWYIGENANNWSKPGNPDGDRLKRLRDLRVDDVNMVVQEKYEENGQTYDVEHAEVWFTFLTEYAWNENTVGYYYFDKNNPPKSAAEIDKKFIIVPNASMPGHQPFGAGKGTNGFFRNTYAPVNLNKRIQLLYVGADGKASKYFPPNTEIGFFLIPNAFFVTGSIGSKETFDGIDYDTKVNGKINTNVTPFYSNYEFNSGSVDGYGSSIKKRFVACRLANGTVVYGCEDGSNESYDDMMFTITATPEKALHTQEGSILQSIPHKQVPRTYTDVNSEQYTYVFEDTWPNGGDYDLNDVAVRHTRKITKDQFNDVTKVVDNFTFLDNSTTGDCNAFAMQTSHSGDTRDLPNGAWFEEETGSFFLANDVRDVKNQTLTMTRTFAHPVSFKEIQNEFHPFIVNQTKGVDCRNNGRIEIHIPGDEVTSKAMKVDNTHNSAKSWYISDDGKYPYALKIPNITFAPCDERERIGSGNGTYPDFNKWTESLGKSYTDWYKRK